MTNNSTKSPSPDRSGAVTQTAAKRCEYCGAAIDTSDWYPVTKGRGADGSLTFYYFDSEECQAAWRDEHGEQLPA